MTEKVKVAVRIRPLPTPTSLLATAPLDERRVCVANRRVYHFDKVFGPNDNTELVFYDSVVSLVDRFLAGYNATVLAYGQTGTGKTFTMAGLTPLVLRYIIENMGGSTSRLSFQCVEVYGETLRDLLTSDPIGSSKHLHLCEGGEDGAVVIVGAARVKARALSEVEDIIEHGTRMRATGATTMNEHSSRSHSIFTIFNHEKGSKLHLVDLAGSERNKKTHNVGQRFRESIAINGGLLALGNVIRALCRNHFQSPDHPGHVPYRSSKLTRFLQDSLGGNSNTLLISCVAADRDNADETIRTLQYSSLAMHVLNEPLPQFSELVSAQSRLHANPNEALSPNANTADDETCPSSSAEMAEMRQHVKELEEQLHTCRAELRKDEATFAQQIQEMRRLIDENTSLKQRVRFLEGAPTGGQPFTPAQGATQSQSLHGQAHKNHMKEDYGMRAPLRWDPQPLPPNPTYVQDTLQLRGASSHEQSQRQEGHQQEMYMYGHTNDIPNWGQSFTPQQKQVYPNEVATSVPIIPTNAPSSAECNPDTTPSLSREREEQLGLLAKEALFYQRSNSELRRRLRSVLSMYEAQQRESAMLRFEVEQIHQLLEGHSNTV